MPKMPAWNPPNNIAKGIEDNDGLWEDQRWSPILVTAMSGTEFNGRDIPVAWQIEFDPSGAEFEAAKAKLEEIEIETDGYGWGEYIQNSIQKANPALAKRLHTSDCETDTCVIWVETADDAVALLEATWTLVFDE